jgi:DNA-directed RNA polymerase specialized sigma24 family protein
VSAALQFTGVLAAAASLQTVPTETKRSEEQEPELTPLPSDAKQPVRTLAFYRKHTEALLRRYLYSSMLIGRAPSLLDHPVARGWATSRPVRTFEEAVNFVLDVEACLAQLSALDRCLLNRVVLQEYTVGEAAMILRISINTVVTRLGIATDRLTAILLKEDLLVLQK